MACGRQDCARTPSFMDTQDLKANTVREARDARKGDESLQAVVAVLRRYRYSAVVAHDFEGEYGHAQHKLTADMLAKVVARAADPAYAPDSAEQYGVWQAKKLYVHLYPKNSITMDWTQPLYPDSPVTPILLAVLTIVVIFLSKVRLRWKATAWLMITASLACVSQPLA